MLTFLLECPKCRKWEASSQKDLIIASTSGKPQLVYLIDGLTVSYVASHGGHLEEGELIRVQEFPDVSLQISLLF